MKTGILFFTLIAITCASINKALVVVSFALNRDMIATELCENRNQPQKHCNGKCYLKKEIAKGETGERKSLPFPLSHLFEDFVWISDVQIFKNDVPFFEQERSMYYSSLAQKYVYFFLQEIAHPPCKIAAA